MTQEELHGLRIGVIIYNKDTMEILEMVSQWHEGKKGIKDDETLSAKHFGDNSTSQWAVIKMNDHEKYEFVNQFAPDKVKLNLLIERVSQLESFVYQRLR